LFGGFANSIDGCRRDTKDPVPGFASFTLGSTLPPWYRHPSHYLWRTIL